MLETDFGEGKKKGGGGKMSRLTKIHMVCSSAAEASPNTSLQV